MGYTSAHYLFRSGKNSKLAYYVRALAAQTVPDSLYRGALQRELQACARLYDEAYIDDRVSYYCRLLPNSGLGDAASALSVFSRRGNGSAYFFDSREIVRWFPKNLRWNYLFGDVIAVPAVPTVVKSRPIDGDNANSVLLKLNKNRHYVYLNDRIPFERKGDRAVYRGQVGTRLNRQHFVEMFKDNPRVDAANTLAKGGILAENPDGRSTVPRLSLYDHLRYRYIMALEGNDVASNLTWFMSSNSLAVTPAMKYESWFMEGRLRPGVHYIEVRDDFSDLETQMDYYSSHPAEAREISRAANLYVAQFRNPRRERYIALLVMKRYFEMTGQPIEP